jgi:hypothetical protein
MSAGSTRTAPRRTISAEASSMSRSTCGLNPKDFRTTPDARPAQAVRVEERV